MDAVPDSRDDNGPDDDGSTVAVMHQAFDHVALSLSCALADLLAETRARGLPDGEVCRVLARHEAEARHGRPSEMHLLCCRSHAGTVYVTRDTAAGNEPVRAVEAFDEVLRGESRGCDRV